MGRNAVLNVLGRLAPLLVGLATIPFVVKGLGSDRFGVLSLAGVITGYFTVFDLGLGRAATRFVAQAIGRREEERIRAIAGTAVVTQAAMGCMASALLILAIPTLIDNVLKLAPSLAAEARATFRIAALSIPFMLIATTWQGVLEATQRFGVLNAIRTPTSSANFLLPLIGVQMGLSLPEIAALMMGLQILTTVLYRQACIALLPSLGRSPTVARRELRVLATYGGWVTISAAIGPIIVYSDRFILASVASVAAVTYYVVPYGLITRLSLIPTSLISTLFPMFATLGDRGDTPEVGRLSARTAQYLLLVLGPVMVVLVLAAHDILRIWLGEPFADRSAVVLQLLAGGVLLNSLARIPYAVLQATDRADLTAKFHIAELPVHIFLTLWLVDVWGVAGAAAAWSLRAAIDCFLLYGAVLRTTSLHLASMIGKRTAVGVALLLVAGCLGALATASVSISGIRLVIALGCAIGAFGSLWLWSLDEAGRASVKGLIRR